MMTASCPATGTEGAFLSSVIRNIDCQAQTIGSLGYQSLSAIGSPAGAALTALLTVFIATVGLRLLMGRTFVRGYLVTLALKVGIVLVIATSWPAFQILAYDTVLKGPSEIASLINGAAGLPSGTGGLLERLQGIDDGIRTFIVTGSGRGDLPDAGLGRTGFLDDTSFGIARSAFLVGVIGAVGATRLTGGLLLAVAPLFAGLLLFKATRPVFAGWARMLAAMALAALFVTIVLAVEVSVVEPWLAAVLSARGARTPLPSTPFELMILLIVFDVLLVLVILCAVRLSFLASTTGATVVLGSERNAKFFDGRGDPLRASQRNEILALQQAVLPGASAPDARLRSSAQTAVLVDANREIGALRTEVQTSPFPIPLGQAGRRTSRRVSAAAMARSARS
jgi:type IV secretion system protein VirB6